MQCRRAGDDPSVLSAWAAALAQQPPQLLSCACARPTREDPQSEPGVRLGIGQASVFIVPAPPLALCQSRI